MRTRSLLAAAAVLAGLLAAPVAASAAPAHPAACVYSYDWQVTGSGTSQGAGATWDTSCGLTMQVRALCHNFITGTSYYAYSGEVKGTGILDWAGCGFADSVLAGQIQPTDCDCTSWHTFWTGGRLRAGRWSPFAGYNSRLHSPSPSRMKADSPAREAR